MKSSIPLAFVFALTFAANLTARAGDGKSGPGADSGPDAAKLWAQNCTRCHNVRPATTYSDAQWDVIVHHMRVRAFLTGEESRLIAQFLKEAN